MLVPVPITPQEKGLGLIVHYHREGVVDIPAVRCVDCGSLLAIAAVKRRKNKATHCSFCGRKREYVGTKGGYLGFLTILLCVMITLGLPANLRAQGNLGSNSSPVVNRQGVPLAGVKIAVCQPLTTTAASVTSNVGVFTFASNPITAGYTAGMPILVAGFTGGDTYLNAGTIINGVITGGWTILSVTSSTVTFAITHANASASSNGTVLQEGNSTTSCAGLSAVFSDPALSIPTANPFTSDQLGNWNVFASSGIYYAQFYSPTVPTTIKIISVSLPSVSSVGGLALNNAWTGNETHSGTETYSLGITGSGTIGALGLGPTSLGANNAWTGNWTSAGTSGLNGGGNISGTWTGSPTLTGVWSWNGSQAAFLSGLLSGPFTSTNIGGEMNFTEVAPFTAAPGVDTLFGSSANHCVEMAYNNGPFNCVAQTATPNPVAGTYRVTGDQTITAGVSLVAVPGLSWTMPANLAINFKFSCDLLYSQATAPTSDSIGVQDVTVSPTSAELYGRADTNTNVFVAANVPTLTTTTATAVVTFTPSASATIFGAHIDGLVEHPSNASTSLFQIMAQFTTNNGTIKRGSSCQVF